MTDRSADEALEAELMKSLGSILAAKNRRISELRELMEVLRQELLVHAGPRETLSFSMTAPKDMVVAWMALQTAIRHYWCEGVIKESELLIATREIARLLDPIACARFDRLRAGEVE